jgi:hypothetical protein
MITFIYTTHNADGIDIYFLNHRNSIAGLTYRAYIKIINLAVVEEIFQSVRPLSGTLTETRFNHIFKLYLTRFKESVKRLAHNEDVSVKPFNIIVIIDGVPSDDVKSVIIKTARKLDQHDAELWQIGI